MITLRQVVPASLALVFAALAYPQDAATSPGYEAKIAAVRSNLGALQTALEGFRHDCGRYPTTREGLAALTSDKGVPKGWNGPYLNPYQLRDAWANPIWYVSTDSGFALASFGADGKPGGKGVDEDLGVSK